MRRDYLYMAALIAAGTALTIYLFQLPKEVLKEKNRQLVEAESSETEKTNNEILAQDSHETSSGKVGERIDFLRSKMSTFLDKEKKRIFADSLAEAYLKIPNTDSADKYLELYLEGDFDLNTKKRGADLYYLAYRLDQRSTAKEKFSAKAIALYKEIISGSSDLTAKTRLGVLLTQSGGTPMEGILLLREVLEEDPEHIEALFSLGEFSVITQQFDKAIGRFEAILAIDPSHIRSLVYLGDCQLATQDKSAARETFEKALEISRGDKFFEQLLEERLKNL